MIGQIIKQPNGKYCIFSSVVDNITYYDMTADEIIAGSSMPARVRQAIDELEEGGKPYLQFTLTFDEMLDKIKQVHGRDELDRVIELVRPGKSKPPKVSEVFGVFHRGEDENLSLIDLYLSETDADERKDQLESYPSYGKWFGPAQIGYRDRQIHRISDIEHYTGMVWLLKRSEIRGMAADDPTLTFMVSEVDKMQALLEYPYPDCCRTGDGTFEVQKHIVL